MKIHTVQLNIADFDKGTNGLSPLEFTIYTRLLLAGYERTLPDNDEILARIARVAKKDIKKVKPVIEEKFKKVDGFFVNSRAEKEKEKYKKISEINSEKAKVRWKIGGLDMPAALQQDSKNDTNSNAHAILPNTHNLTPNNHNLQLKTPTPTLPQEKSRGVFLGSGSEWVGKLSGKSYDKAKENARGWDITGLMEIYIQGIPKRGMPKSLNAAFPAWCLKYTKGIEL